MTEVTSLPNVTFFSEGRPASKAHQRATAYLLSSIRAAGTTYDPPTMLNAIVGAYVNYALGLGQPQLDQLSCAGSDKRGVEAVIDILRYAADILEADYKLDRAE